MSTPQPATRPDLGPLTLRSGRVRAARRLTARAARAERREFLAEGPQAVREALGAGVTREVFATSAATHRHDDLAAAASAQHITWHVVAEEVVGALADTVTPQGIIARCAFVDVSLHELMAAQPSLLAVLDEVRDPGNAGTVIRCADACGAAGVALSRSSVDPYNGKVVRASAGSLFHLPVAVAPSLDHLVDLARGAGLQVLAADASGEVGLDQALEDGRLAGPTAWLFGNEARGLAEEALSLSDAVVSVPIPGRAESLNLATAAAVCLYATAWAQRRRGGCRKAATGQ